MKLTDLDPEWLIKDGQRVGFTFLSPSGPQNGVHWRQSCFVIPSPPTREQWVLFEAVHGEDFEVQGCTAGVTWSIEGGIHNAWFETLTVKPSIDGSAGGQWHGFITNGEVA